MATDPTDTQPDPVRTGPKYRTGARM